MNTQPAIATAALPVIYALFWESSWAGDVPGPSMIFASFDRAQVEAHPKLGETTYDGVSARTQGRYVLRELTPTKRLQTLADMGAELTITREIMPGAWIGDRRVESTMDENGLPTFTGEESRYVIATYAAKNPKGWAKKIEY